MKSKGELVRLTMWLPDATPETIARYGTWFAERILVEGLVTFERPGKPFGVDCAIVEDHTTGVIVRGVEDYDVREDRMMRRFDVYGRR